MKTIENLREELAKVLAQVESGDIGAEKASVLNNIAGIMINSVTIEMDYDKARNGMRKGKLNIEFLNKAK